MSLLLSAILLHWDSVLQGTITGLVGASVLALLATFRNGIRDKLQAMRLKRDLNRASSVGSGIHGITKSIYNETGREMVVRQVAFLMGEIYIVLLATGELTSSYKGKTRKPTRAEMKRLKKGEMVQMGSEMQFGSWKVAPNSAGFVTLPPYTQSSFLLPAQFVADSPESIRSIRVVIEYVTKSGDRRILQHDLKSKHPEQIEKTLAHLRDEIRGGSFNKARRMFRMPEVVLKSEVVRPQTETPPKPD